MIKSLEQVEFNNHTINQNSGNNGIGINYVTVDKLSELYERLLLEKDEVIKSLKKQLNGNA